MTRGRPPLTLSIGQKFGRWTVMGRSAERSHGCIMWIVRCECGGESSVSGSSLTGGKSTQCVTCRNAHTNARATHPRNDERERYAVAARVMGDTYGAIAVALGISRARAEFIVKRARREMEARCNS